MERAKLLVESAGKRAAPSVPVAAPRTSEKLSRVLPARPEMIQTDAASPLAAESKLGSKLAVGAAHSAHEAEADRMAERISGVPAGARAGGGAAGAMEAPASVHRVLASRGEPLDGGTRAQMETQFGRDLSGVRVHTGGEADRSAQAVGARAFAVGNDAVFAAGQYRPQSREGRRLLAHELSHTVQQAGGGTGLSAAPLAVHRDPPKTGAPAPDAPAGQPKTDKLTLTATWDDLILHQKLTPPSLLGPKPPAPPLLASPGTLSLDPSVSGANAGPSQAHPWTLPQSASPAHQPTLLTPPSLGPPPPPGPVNGPLAPLASGQQAAASAGAGPAAPSRLALGGTDVLSIGLRLGFPDTKDSKVGVGPGPGGPGTAPSALADAIKQGEIINFHLTGAVPSAYQVDTGKLVGAVWGIVSEKIAPDLAKKIAAKMSSKPAGTGLTYELDVTLLYNKVNDKTNAGGGLSLTVNF